MDGSSQALGRKTKTALVPSPGVRRVFVCKTFAEVQLRQPGTGESGDGRQPGGRYNARVQGPEFDEAEFFRAIAASGTRALLIGRRALVALGIPVLTADYDFWLHVDDIVAFNAAAEPQGLFPTRTPDEARGRGRYVLENDERVDVLVAHTVPTVDGVRVAFEDVWSRRHTLEVGAGVAVEIGRASCRERVSIDV